MTEGPYIKFIAPEAPSISPEPDVVIEIPEDATAEEIAERITSAHVCTTCHGKGEIQTTEWPALYSIYPDCKGR